MKKQEHKLILDLYKHYKSIDEISNDEIDLLYDKYGNIRNILKNLIQEFEPNSEVTEDYLDEKLKMYEISEIDVSDEIEQVEILKTDFETYKKSKKKYLLLGSFFSIILFFVGWLLFNKSSVENNQETNALQNENNLTQVETNVKVKLLFYECGDNCYVEFQRIDKPSIIYDFHNFDTDYYGGDAIKAIENHYYNYNNIDALIGKIYIADFSYKKVEEFEETEYGPRNTGKYVEKWVITKLYELTNNSENNATNFNVICEEKSVNSTSSEPILIKSCILNNFKSVSTGEADYKGRYSYKYEVFIKKNGAYVKSNNEDLFNEKKEELLKLINQKIKIDFEDYASNPETKDCFEGITFTNYTYENLGIEFTDDKINFNVWFDVFEYCFNVSSTTVSFGIEEIKPYLNKKY